MVLWSILIPVIGIPSAFRLAKLPPARNTGVRS